MNKKELIDEIAKRADMPKSEVMCAVGHLRAVIQEMVAKGEPVAIQGFGSFELVHTPARTARAFGREIQVAEKWTPKFKPSTGWVGLCTETQGGDR